MKQSNSIKQFGIIGTLAAAILLASCGQVSVSATAKADAAKTAELGCVQAQVSSMLSLVTEISLDIQGEDYTFAKNQVGYDKDGTTVLYKALFTFKGKAAQGDNGFTLSPATSVSYDIDYSTLKTTLGDEMFSLLVFLPTDKGTVSNSTEASLLNYFYTPFVKNNETNTKSMIAKVDGTNVTFDGFELVAAEED